MKNIALAKAIKILGGQKKLGEQLGVAQSCVWKWLHNQTSINLAKAIEIEDKTNGQVRCEELRPDINWSVLRNKH